MYLVVGRQGRDLTLNILRNLMSHSGFQVAQQGTQLYFKQESQLMLTNPRDAFRGQSRSRNMVPFHMFGMVSY